MIARVLAALLFVWAAGATARPVAAPHSVALQASESAAGGFVLGNPKAPVHLLEFASFTCPHCAHFTDEGAAPLKRTYLAQAKVVYEVRNAVRDPFDMIAALLARCGGAPRFFGNMEAIFAAQDQWTSKIRGLHLEKRPKSSPADMMAFVAEGTGLNALMRKRGFSNAQLQSCLTDKAAQGKILAMTKDADETRQIPGTPSFYVNNVLQGVADWPSLKSNLEEALSAIPQGGK